MHTVLHGALKHALKNRLVTRNVSEATTRPSGKARKIQPLTLEQTRQFLTAIKEDRWFPAMFLELGTGLRRGELLALCWRHLDLEAGVLHVRQELVRVRNHDAARVRGKPASPSWNRRLITHGSLILRAVGENQDRASDRCL